MPEAETQARILLAVGALPGIRLFRNTVGFGYQGEVVRIPGLPPNLTVLRDARPVTFGLAPDSPDLVGWRSVIVTADMIGKRIAQLAAPEVKTATGRASKGQLHFIDVLQRAGAISGIVRNADEAKKLLGVN